jgi:TrpR-related protein YerC/YecD
MKLAKVLTKITNEKIMVDLLADITTPKELKALQERLDIALLLNKDLSYSEIAKKTSASTTTVTRVARFLNQEKHGGYRYVIDNLKKFK